MKKLIPFLIISFSFSYQIKEFVTCKMVKNHIPIKPTTHFTIKDKKVWAFGYFKYIKRTKIIDFLWEKKVNNKWKLYADVRLPIKKGYRWRTFSYIRIRPYFKGIWKVSLFEKNKTLKSIEFNITD